MLLLIYFVSSHAIPYSYGNWEESTGKHLHLHLWTGQGVVEKIAIIKNAIIRDREYFYLDWDVAKTVEK